MERRMQALKELGAQRTVYDAERAAYSSGFSAGERRAERSVMEDDRSAKVLERCLSRSGLDVDIWWFWYLQTFDASASVHTWCVARRDGAALQSYVLSAASSALRWAGAVFRCAVVAGSHQREASPSPQVYVGSSISLVSPVSLLLQSRRMCTAHPACRLDTSRSIRMM